MDLPLILLLEGVLFIVVFQGMSLLRQEGFSNQSALEVLALTVLFAGAAWLTGLQVHPVLMLVGDLPGRHAHADPGGLWQPAGAPAALPPGRKAVRLGLPPVAGCRGEGDRAAEPGDQPAVPGQISGGRRSFHSILERAKTNRLGDKYRAAAHYNLGVAYRKQGNEPQARSEFTEVLELLPISEYGRLAHTALESEK